MGTSRLVRLAVIPLAALLLLAGLAGTSNASIGLGTVVSANPANFTPNVASVPGSTRAVYKFLQVGTTMYAGGAISSVSTAPGVTPGGTFRRSNLFAFNAGNGVISNFAPSINGAVWALASDGASLYVGGEFTSVNGVARRGLAKINRTTGAVDASFNAGFTSGRVTELAVVGNRLIVGGSIPKQLVALKLNTGANTNYLKLGIAGRVADNAGVTNVYRFAVNPARTRLLAIGNFTAPHPRAFMVDLGPTAGTLDSWRYDPLTHMCSAASLPAYLRDVDFSPDGKYFVIVSTGYVPQAGGVGRDVCDATARFGTATPNPTRPTWINYTGGDTLHSVAVTDKAVYVQGHQRWLDNPHGANSAGPGAVSRPGIGAINPATGKALGWNPTKDRGEGGKDLLVTGAGLWVGSDTTHIGGETHARIALMPK